jgi:outer membrane lipopolysaccharide assembly protein LptE/RlpB
MSENTQRARLLHETIAPYTTRDSGSGVTKISISLPADLVEIVRASARNHGLSVSATITAALRRTMIDAEQARLDAALELDAEENIAWAEAYAPIAAELISKLEW